jgi:hypothetical protein
MAATYNLLELSKTLYIAHAVHYVPRDACNELQEIYEMLFVTETRWLFSEQKHFQILFKWISGFSLLKPIVPYEFFAVI